MSAGGTDMLMGLHGSVRNERSGDCDLGDGSFQQRMHEHHEGLHFEECIGIKQHKASSIVCKRLDPVGGHLLKVAMK